LRSQLARLRSMARLTAIGSVSGSHRWMGRLFLGFLESLSGRFVSVSIRFRFLGRGRLLILSVLSRSLLVVLRLSMSRMFILLASGMFLPAIRVRILSALRFVTFSLWGRHKSTSTRLQASIGASVMRCLWFSDRKSVGWGE